MTRKTLALLAAVALAGCGRTGAGVAARVGDERIPTSAVAEHTARAMADRTFAQTQDVRNVQRVWVRRLIEEKLVDEAARRLGVALPKGRVDKAYDEYVARFEGKEQLERAAASDGIGPADIRGEIARAELRELIADKLVEDIVLSDAQLRDTYLKNIKDYDKAHLAHINVADPRKAANVAAQARHGGDFAALAKANSEDVRTQATGGDLGVVGNGEGKLTLLEREVFKPGVTTGAILGPIRSGSTYEIVKVVERRTTPFEQAREDVRRRVIGDERVKRLSDYLQKLAHELGLSVNPRFGRWDYQQGIVVPRGDDLSSPAPSPGDLQPAGP